MRKFKNPKNIYQITQEDKRAVASEGILYEISQIVQDMQLKVASVRELILVTDEHAIEH